MIDFAIPFSWTIYVKVHYAIKDIVENIKIIIFQKKTKKKKNLATNMKDFKNPNKNVLT